MAIGRFGRMGGGKSVGWVGGFIRGCLSGSWELGRVRNGTIYRHHNRDKGA